MLDLDPPGQKRSCDMPVVGQHPSLERAGFLPGAWQPSTLLTADHHPGQQREQVWGEPKSLNRPEAACPACLRAEFYLLISVHASQTLVVKYFSRSHTMLEAHCRLFICPGILYIAHDEKVTLWGACSQTTPQSQPQSSVSPAAGPGLTSLLSPTTDSKHRCRLHTLFSDLLFGLKSKCNSYVNRINF